MPDDTSRTDAVDRALHNATTRLLGEQQPDGSWRSGWDTGPAMTGQLLAALEWLGELSDREAERCAVYLWRQLLPDGSFAAYPGAEAGDFVTTANVYAGLYAAGVPAADARMATIWRYLQAQGGFAKLDPFTLSFLVMAGVVDPIYLVDVPMNWVLLPGVQGYLSQRLIPAVTLMFYQFPAVLRGLRARVRTRSPIDDFVSRFGARAVLAYISAKQDPRSGSWIAALMHTLMGMAALRALDVPRSDARYQRALASLATFRIDHGEGGVSYVAFTSELWDTALAMSSLQAAGVPGDAEAMRRAAAWVVSWQSEVDAPRDWQTPARGAPRRGGFAFQTGNLFSSDCDSTSEVLRGLVGVAEATKDPALARAVERGAAWMLGMQNADGGWASFTHGHPGKPPGPIDLNVPLVPQGLDALKLVLDPPLAYGDPSGADLSGRVMTALGRLGKTVRDPAVRAGARFLRDQQDDNRAWWGRWEVNYAPGTAYVLTGLAAVGEDLSQPYIRDAFAWLLAHQNSDGGWGETVDSYDNLALAGRGPSTAYTTGLAVTAFVAAGKRELPEVARAVDYLLAAQLPGGLWSQANYELVLQPPVPYYRIRSNAITEPLAGLANWRRAIRIGSWA